MKKTTNIKTEAKIIFALIVLFSFAQVFSVYGLLNPGGFFVFPGFWWFTFSFAMSLFLVICLSSNCFDIGHRFSFENPDVTYKVTDLGGISILEGKVNNYVYSKIKTYKKTWKKMLDLNERSSQTFTTFEKEKLVAMMRDVYLTYKVCLSANEDVHHAEIRLIFSEAVRAHFLRGSYEARIIADNAPQFAVPFNIN